MTADFTRPIAERLDNVLSEKKTSELIKSGVYTGNDYQKLKSEVFSYLK
jgi:hypothetical protein